MAYPGHARHAIGYELTYQDYDDISDAGQAVVQFARGAKDPGQYALKFFLSDFDFRSERAVYTDSPLGKLLPRHYGIYENVDGVLRDRRGYKLPACIVMERGESLDEWSKRKKPDVWGAMPVSPSLVLSGA